MQFLIAVLLLSYPREFRRSYGPQIVRDAGENRNTAYRLRIAVDIVRAGIGMRLESLWRDLRFAIRMLVKVPLFTTIVVATVALAIAGNAVIYSLLDAVLLQPLPYSSPARLGTIEQISKSGAMQRFLMPPTKKDTALIRASATAFDGITQVDSPERVVVTVDRKSAAIDHVEADANYFDVLGVKPKIGQLFTPALTWRAHAAVISEAFWRKQFDASPAAVGKSFALDGVKYTIIGVVPAAFVDISNRILTHNSIWTIPPPPTPATGIYSDMTMIVRLKNDMTFAAAQADIDRVIAGANEQPQRTLVPDRVLPLTDTVLGAARQFLWIVFSAVSAVLLIACANIANLLLVRAAARAPELAMRATLGATSSRIGVQLLTEMIVLFATGAAIGVAIAWPALPIVRALMPDGFPRIEQAHISGNVVAYVCVLTSIVTLLAGVLPSLWQNRTQPASALKGIGRSAADRGARARAILVAVEVAAAFALTVSSGLLLRSYVGLISQDVGFTAQGLYNANFFGTRSINAPKDPTLASRIAARIRLIPGVDDASIATVVPFSSAMQLFMTTQMDGGPAPLAGIMDPRFISNTSSVTPDFFRVLRVPLHRGRMFSELEHTSSIAVVNEAFVKKFVPHGDPLRARIHSGKQFVRIIGVVADMRNSLTGDIQPEYFTPYLGDDGFQIVVRTHGNVPGLATAIAQATRQVTSTMTPPPVQSMRTIIVDDAARTHAALILLGSLSLLALVLALGGIYGIVSYSTQRRYHEIGIRMALGAQPANVLRRIISGAIVQTAVGVGAGIIIAAFTTKLLSGFLDNVSPIDPATFVATVLAFIACAVIAALIPGVRAARSDPATTLRYE